MNNTSYQEHLQMIRSVKALDEAVAKIFQNNFDAESKVCLLTLIKMLDNILQQPSNTKVRTIRVSNPTFDRKVASCKGGLEFLHACGFVAQKAPAPLLSAPFGSDVTGGEELLVLSDEAVDDTSHLITARRLLMTRAIQDLGIPADQIPPFQQPPPKAVLVDNRVHGMTSTGRTNTTNVSHGGTVQFNPYVGHRFDAKSAALGANLGPDANYVSPTEVQLQQLQKQQAELEAQLQKPMMQQAQQQNRWIGAFRPGEAISVDVSSVEAGAAAASGAPPSDANLIAAQFKRQQEERIQRDQGGFTTKAMRDLQRLKKAKVYSHATITIQFPDGCRVLGRFLPKDTLATVQQALRQDCFFVPDTPFDFYITPPRRLLSLSNTLQDEGLVPAAKIYVSWKAAAAAPSSANGSYLKPELFAMAAIAMSGQALSTTTSAATRVIFPIAQPVVGSSINNNDSATAGATDKSPADSGMSAEESAIVKEEAMLRRMMGGSGGGGGGGTLKKSKPATTDDGPAPSSAASRKPKGFK